MNSVRIQRPTTLYETNVEQTDVELGVRAARRFLAQSLAWESRLTTLRAAADGGPIAESIAEPHVVTEAA